MTVSEMCWTSQDFKKDFKKKNNSFDSVVAQWLKSESLA